MDEWITSINDSRNPGQSEGFVSAIPRDYVKQRYGIQRDTLVEILRNDEQAVLIPLLTGGAYIFNEFIEERVRTSQFPKKNSSYPLRVSSRLDENTELDEIEIRKVEQSELKSAFDAVGQYGFHVPLMYSPKELNGRNVVLFEDMIDKATTAVQTTQYLRDLGVQDIMMFYYGHKEGVEEQISKMRELSELGVRLLPCFAMTSNWVAGLGSDSGKKGNEFKDQFRHVPTFIAKIDENAGDFLKYKDNPEINGYRREENGLYMPERNITQI